MANLENNSVDTRTFAQICDGLTKLQWIDLQNDLASKLKRSHQCIWNWKKGIRIPSSASEARDLSNLINRKYGILTRYWTLFPAMKI